MSRHPIAEYALLSDCHSAALVHRTGSVDWLCLPRFDSPSVFARLLDDRAGHWSIEVAGTRAIRRRYLNATLVLETEFETATGRLLLTDALAVGPNERGHELGARSPHALLRRVECTAGTVELTMELRLGRRTGSRTGAAESRRRPAGEGGLVSAAFLDSAVPHRRRSGECRRIPAGGRVPDVRAAVPCEGARRLLVPGRSRAPARRDDRRVAELVGRCTSDTMARGRIWYR